MGYASFSLSIPVGLDVNQALNFNPTAVIVSNYSPYYLYFADAANFCPPWTSGAVIPLSHATRGRVSWGFTPFGAQIITTPPVGVTYIANLVFSDDPNLTLSGGTLVIIPPDTRSVQFSAAPGATITTGTLSYPTIGCRVDNNTGTWYQIGTTGFLIPPYTTGFTVDLLPAITSLIVAPTTPPYGGPNNTGGTNVTVTLYAGYIGNSSGNTVIVGYPIQLLQSAVLATITQNSTISLPAPATANNLLVAVFACASGSVSTVVTGPAGWTTIYTSAAANMVCWIGYKKATGGETSALFSLSTVSNQSSSMAIAEYTGFDPAIFQVANAAGNTTSTTPVTSPLIAIGMSAYTNTSSIAAGAVTSIDTVIRTSITGSDGVRRSGAAISDLNYENVSAKTVTLVWSGGAALRTGIIAGE